MNKYVGEYFEKIASDFDSYYDRPKSFSATIINELLRKPGLLKRLQMALVLTDPKPGLRVLDVGCGSGKYVVECAKAGAEVKGIDISPEMIRLAKEFCETNHVSASLSVGDATKKLENGFDVCCALGVIEYFQDPTIILRNMVDTAKSKVIFSVPKLFAFQYPLREIMLHYKGVDCYYYTKQKINSIASNFEYESLSIHECGPVYVACMKLK